MLLIAHRGNMNGPNPEKENTLEYLGLALAQGYGVEVDIWVIQGMVFLKHDEPTLLDRPIDLVELWKLKQNENVFFHCKNIQALVFLTTCDLAEQSDFFMHDKDKAVLTANGWIWTAYPEHVGEDTIIIAPRMTSWDLKSRPYAICSDYVSLLHQQLHPFTWAFNGCKFI